MVKNESACIEGMVLSVINYIDEVVLVDTGSTDDTAELVEAICIKNKIPFRLYRLPQIENFGMIRTITCHLADSDYVLTLDADERLSNPEVLKTLTKNWAIEAYAFPRRRWLDLEMTKQTELEAYPDFQVRLFKNNKSYVWKRELHEFFDGAAVENLETNCPIIEHLHDVYKTNERLMERYTLYQRLSTKAGVTIEGGHEI